MRIRLIYDHIAHHARCSGYDQLAKHVDAEPFASGGLAHRWAQRISWQRLQRFGYYASKWYGGPALRRELEICAKMLLPRGTLYHFLYAENDLRVASLWRLRLNNKVVGTFHTPPEYLDTHEADKRYIAGVSAAVVVARTQIPFLAQLLPEERIFHVPHGIDTEYWCPDERVPRWRQPTFAVVGTWFRDVALIVATIRAIHRIDARIRFRIVCPPEHRERFDGLANAEVMSGIPDDLLRELYRSSRALLLPLELSTANNAVLEAMACGTGVITTRSGGVREYVDDACGALLDPGDVDATVAEVRALARDDDRVARIGNAARAHAVARYAWPVVAAQMMAAYRAIQAL